MSAPKIFLGLGAILAVPFLVWRTFISQRQNELEQENIHSTTMAKAIEQLGAMKEEKVTHGRAIPDGNPPPETITNSKPNIEVRLGAIYLLEKLAREHEQLHWPIMEILCAYVRENAGRPKPPPREVIAAYIAGEGKTEEQEILIERYDNALDPPRVDIQAAVTVIGRRSIKQLEWESSFKKLNNPAYRLDFRNCHLAKIRLSGFNFSGADFRESSLERANCHKSILNEALFSEAHIQRAYFSEVFAQNAFFDQAHLEDADLSHGRFDGSRFWRANLEVSDCKFAHFKDSFARLANFEGASLFYAHFDGARLNGVHFEGANLTKAFLTNVELSGVRLNDAMVDDTDLTQVKYLTEDMIIEAWGNSNTSLPDGIGFPINNRWAKNESEITHQRTQLWRQRRLFWLKQAANRVHENNN